MSYPSNLETLDTDIGAQQSTAARNHSAQHNNANRILNALQILIGVANSTEPTTVTYKLNHAISQLASIITQLGINPNDMTVNAYSIACVFDNAGADLPTAVPGVVDGYTLLDGDLVYVKNSSNSWRVNHILQAHVGATITYTDVITLWVGDTINISGGTVYGGTIYVYSLSDNAIHEYNGGTTGLKAITTAGTSTAYTLLVPGYSAYSENDILMVKIHVNNGTDPTLNINGLGAKDINLAGQTLRQDNIIFLGYIGGEYKVITNTGGGSGITPTIVNTASHTAQAQEYIVVTYVTGDCNITLPDATLNEGVAIKVKKYTWEDVNIVTILPHGAQTIDGYTGLTMNLDNTMVTLTCVNGNRIIGD